MDDAKIKYSTVQNWYPGDANGKGGIYNFVTNAARAGARIQKFVDPGGNRSASRGSTRPAFCRAMVRWVSFIPWR